MEHRNSLEAKPRILDIRNPVRADNAQNKQYNSLDLFPLLNQNYNPVLKLPTIQKSKINMKKQKGTFGTTKRTIDFTKFNQRYSLINGVVVKNRVG